MDTIQCLNLVTPPRLSYRATSNLLQGTPTLLYGDLGSLRGHHCVTWESRGCPLGEQGALQESLGGVTIFWHFFLVKLLIFILKMFLIMKCWALLRRNMIICLVQDPFKANYYMELSISKCTLPTIHSSKVALLEYQRFLKYQVPKVRGVKLVSTIHSVCSAKFKINYTLGIFTIVREIFQF